MSDPIALGDTLPELVENLIGTKMTDDDICKFSARGEDYDTFWVEGWPGQALVEPSPDNWSVPLWICFPVARVSISGEELSQASTVKLYPGQRILVIMDKDGEILETSSPITLITPSPI